MVKSWPSCWMTMPGRSCVALTLLICSLERLRISEIQAGQEHGRIRNDSRHAGRKKVSNAKQQYKCARSWRSIVVALLGLLGALVGTDSHDLFDFNGIAGEAFAEQLVAGLGDEDVVLDADPEILFGYVDAGLDGDEHAGLQRRAVLSGVVDIEADMMAEAVNKIRAEGLAVAIFSVGVDVIVGELVNALVALGAVVRARLQRSDGRILRTEDDVVDFALARRKLAVGGQRARDVRGVAGVLRPNVEHHDVAVFDLARELVVVQRGGVWAGANNRGVTLRFGAAPGVNFDHFRRHLIFVEPRAHQLHRFEVRIKGQVNRLFQEGDFAERLDLAHGADLRANIFQLGLRRSELQPIDNGLFVRVAAEFLLIGKNRIEIRKCLRKILDHGAEVALERFYGNKSCARFNARVRRRHANAVPFFFLRILCGEKKCFARNIRDIALLTPGKDNQAGAFFVVAGEVVEILFLGEEVGLRNFFAAGEAPKNDGPIGLRRELGAAFGVDAIGFAFAALLGYRAFCKASQEEQSQENQCCWIQ